MKTYQTILVGASLDERDTTTMRFAALFAKAADSKTVYVAHVVPTFDLPPELTGPEAHAILPRDEEIEQQLEALVARHRTEFPPQVRFHAVARQGPTTAELIRLASQKSADLFCLGRRPAEAGRRLSDAGLHLVRKSPCSVFVVPPEAEPRCQHILVPVDFSDHSREALEVACALARTQPQATITVQHTYEIPVGWHKSGHSFEEFAAIMRRNAQRHWEKFAQTLACRDPAWKVRFDQGDDVPQTILRVAEDINADLLVLGSHGRTQSAGVLLGHVVDVICAESSRPVLCVKRKGEIVNFLHALLQFYGWEDD
ncbi:MAG: universal stress protein [Gemmataceae bacterium]|nr:universal stress protein [Gemmataceae bacterium]MDW8266544.1 universal stress protein [Gemmataceae bacterium]